MPNLLSHSADTLRLKQNHGAACANEGIKKSALQQREANVTRIFMYPPLELLTMQPVPTLLGSVPSKHVKPLMSLAICGVAGSL
jgi:hypothetical protein